MPEQLALALRPRTFDEMIGAERLVANIRQRVANRSQKAWLFCGETGSGKTSISHIIAVSLQCRHQTVFGNPCRKCYHNRHSFDITDLNMPDISVKELRDVLDGAYYSPKPGSRRRVYILDEAHMMSKAAQNLMLKYTEDCPRTTNWIIATTEPDSLRRTLRRRCAVYVLPGLGLEGIQKLVKRGLEELKSDFSASELVERLMEKQVTSSGLILNAVEKYVSGETPDAASNVELVSAVNTDIIVHSLIKGDWESIALQMQEMKSEDVTYVQVSVCRFLESILLGDKDFSSRTDVVAKSIEKLSTLTGPDKVRISALSAQLYKVAHYFYGHKR